MKLDIKKFSVRFSTDIPSGIPYRGQVDLPVDELLQKIGINLPKDIGIGYLIVDIEVKIKIWFLRPTIRLSGYVWITT